MAARAKPESAEREEPKPGKPAAAGFANPLVVAILAAAVAATGNAIVALINGQQTRRVEEVRAEAGRILEMIKTGDPDTAAENLRFLAESGLISDPERVAAIRGFLATRSPGQGPALPTAGGRDVARSAQELPADDRLRALSGGVGQLLVDGGFRCTAFVAAPGLLVVPDFCLPAAGEALTFSHAGDARDPAAVSVLAVNETPVETAPLGEHAAALLAFETPADAIPALRLATAAPQVGDAVSTLFFRLGQGQLAARDGACVIVEVTETEFAQPCTMGTGASGAPVLSADGSVVVGVHARREPRDDGALYWALRADRIVAGSTLLAGAD